MGVVANPVPERDFDGKIFLRRISKEEKYKKKSHHQNFTDDASLNGQLKDGEWKQLVVDDDDMRLTNLRESIVENFFLDEETTDSLVLRYYSDSSSDKPKAKYIDQPGALVPPTDCLDGYTLMVRNSAGDKRMVGITCDSEFMEMSARLSVKHTTGSNPTSPSTCTRTTLEGTARSMLLRNTLLPSRTITM